MNILNIIKATFVKLKNKEKLRSAKSAIVDSKDVFEGSNFIGKNAVVKDLLHMWHMKVILSTVK